MVSAVLTRQSRNVPGPLSAVLVTVHVIAGHAFEPSSRRPAHPLAKLAAGKIEQIDNREIANAIWSAEADLEPVSFFIFVLGVHPESPEAAGKTDIFFCVFLRQALDEVQLSPMRRRWPRPRSRKRTWRWPRKRFACWCAQGAFVVQTETTLVPGWWQKPGADWRNNQVPNQRFGLCQSLRDTASVRAIGNVQLCRNFLICQGNQSIPTHWLA
jgi:hypothetical protein